MAKKAEKVKVQMIRHKGQATLVQWVDDDGVHRGSVPNGSVEDGVVSRETLEMAIPYGFPWAELVELSATPESIEARLHQVGIWTLDDLQERPNAALGAIQAAYRFDLSALVNRATAFARKQQKVEV